MPKFYVLRPEIHISRVEIEADTFQEAFEAVKDDQGEEVSLGYERTVQPHESIHPWRVEDDRGHVHEIDQ